MTVCAAAHDYDYDDGRRSPNCGGRSVVWTALVAVWVEVVRASRRSWCRSSSPVAPGLLRSSSTMARITLATARLTAISMAYWRLTWLRRGKWVEEEGRLMPSRHHQSDESL